MNTSWIGRRRKDNVIFGLLGEHVVQLRGSQGRVSGRVGVRVFTRNFIHSARGTSPLLTEHAFAKLHPAR